MVSVATELAEQEQAQPPPPQPFPSQLASPQQPRFFLFSFLQQVFLQSFAASCLSFIAPCLLPIVIFPTAFIPQAIVVLKGAIAKVKTKAVMNDMWEKGFKFNKKDSLL